MNAWLLSKTAGIHLLQRLFERLKQLNTKIIIFKRKIKLLIIAHGYATIRGTAKQITVWRDVKSKQPDL